MGRLENDPPSSQEFLQNRLNSATNLAPERTKEKRGNRLQSTRPLRKLDGLNYASTVGGSFSEITNSAEMFVTLVEHVKKFKLADKNVKAKRLLSLSLQIARRLDDQLPGDDEGVKFFMEGLSFLEEKNPILAEDISRIMQKVYDEKRFQTRR